MKSYDVMLGIAYLVSSPVGKSKLMSIAGLLKSRGLEKDSEKADGRRRLRDWIMLDGLMFGMVGWGTYCAVTASSTVDVDTAAASSLVVYAGEHFV
jgi:hypothetical protein